METKINDNIYGYENYNKMARFKFAEDKIQTRVINFVNSMIASGYDADADDILFDGIVNGIIDLDNYFLINNYGEICMEMDTQFDTSNMALGYMRFLLRLMSKDVFDKYEIRRLVLMYGINEYALRTYTNLSEEEIVKLLLEVQEIRENVE